MNQHTQTVMKSQIQRTKKWFPERGEGCDNERTR